MHFECENANEPKKYCLFHAYFSSIESIQVNLNRINLNQSKQNQSKINLNRINLRSSSANNAIVRFDVPSLFTNIPVDETVNIILDGLSREQTP